MTPSILFERSSEGRTDAGMVGVAVFVDGPAEGADIEVSGSALGLCW